MEDKSRTRMDCEQFIREIVTRRVGSYKWSCGCLSGESDEEGLVGGCNEVFLDLLG